MTPNKKILAGGVALVALAAGAVAASAHRGGPGGPMGGFGGPRHHGLMGAICRGNGPEMADHILISIEYKVKPTDAQKPAFEELKAAARTAATKAQAACPPAPPAPAKTADGTPPPPPPMKSPVERLASMEASLTAELEAVRTVRPAAEKFYASLSDDQKKALAEHRPGGPGWGPPPGGPGGPDGWHHHHGWNGDHNGPPPPGQDGAPPPAAKP